MAKEGDKGNDFYAVLGLNKECTESELRNAYKRLALVRIESQCFFYNFPLFTLSTLFPLSLLRTNPLSSTKTKKFQTGLLKNHFF